MMAASNIVSKPSYRYTELRKNEIRLLELLPLHEGLTGRIHHFTLPKKQNPNRDTAEVNGTQSEEHSPHHPTYDALSHHWGMRPSERSPTISIIDKDDRRYELSIRQGLKDCLDVLLQAIKDEGDDPRTERKSCRYIWVDAICINQESGHDKNAQLPRMGDIYNGARRVIVWLGPAADDSDLAVDFIEELQDLDSLSSFIEHKDDTVPPKWKALAELSRRPWFTRLWIVQEISAAKEAFLLCGRRWVAWDHFAGAISLFASQNDGIRQMLREAGEFARNKDYLGEINESGVNKLVEAKSSVVRKRDDGTVAEHLLSLEALLMSLSSFEASEAHDVVYAILWLSSDARPEDEDHPAPRIHSYNCITPRNRSPSRSFTHEPQVSEAYAQHTVHPDEGAFDPDHVRTVLHERSDESKLQSGRKTKHMRGQSQSYLGVPATTVEAQESNETVKNNTGGITIDYTAEVYQTIAQVIQHVIEMYGTLDLMRYPWAPPPQQKDENAKPPRKEDEEAYPSWILPRTERAFKFSPNDQIKVLRRVNADPLVGRPGARPYFACGKLKARDARIKDKCLIAPGWWLEELSAVGNPAGDAVLPSDWLELIKWTEPGKQPLPDWFWRTLVGNRGSSGFGDPPPRFKTACMSIFKTRAESANLNLPNLLSDGKLNPISKEYVDRAISVIFNRRLLIASSSKGDGKVLYGLGPKGAALGDRICILAGCSVPVLLRPVKGRSKSSYGSRLDSHPADDQAPSVQINGAVEKVAEDHVYTFVGECYIDGMMNGECFRYAEDRNREMEDLYIV